MEPVIGLLDAANRFFDKVEPLLKFSALWNIGSRDQRTRDSAINFLIASELLQRDRTRREDQRILDREARSAQEAAGFSGSGASAGGHTTSAGAMNETPAQRRLPRRRVPVSPEPNEARVSHEEAGSKIRVPAEKKRGANYACPVCETTSGWQGPTWPAFCPVCRAELVVGDQSTL